MSGQEQASASRPSNAEVVAAEIGPVLRAARLKRAQTIEIVSQQTRIPKRYLEALESDRFDEFPAPVYARGFLKSYCEHLNVSFEELWAKIQPPPAPTPIAPIVSSAVAEETTQPSRQKSDPTAIAATVLGVGLLIAIVLWISKGRSDARPKSSPASALLPLARATESLVSVRTIDEQWIRVTVDGNTVFAGLLPHGASMEWKPTRSLSLHATAPSSLRLTINGASQPLPDPSPDGEYQIVSQ